MDDSMSGQENAGSRQAKRHAKKLDRRERELIAHQMGIGEPGSIHPGHFQTLGRAQFISGLQADQMWSNLGDVLVNVQGIRFQNNGINELFLWDDLESVEFESMSKEKSRVANVAVFGVLGLGARSSMTQSVLEAQHSDGRHLALVFTDIDPISIRVKLTAALRSVDRQLGRTESCISDSSGAKGSEFAESLLRLGEMREKGLLSDEEFHEAKRRLLSE